MSVNSKNLPAAILFTCFVLLLFVTSWCAVEASSGDRTAFFRNCRENCERTNCTADGIDIQEQALRYYKQSVFDKVFQWTCADECQYGCMWRTVDAFEERGWSVPQFYGKWPFVRFLGLQEPASVVFSVINLMTHWRMLRKFRREVRRDSPCYKLWHMFAFVCLNGWIFSAVFHTRDFPLTELLDYAFAYAIVLATLYCMVIRMIHRYSIFLRGVISLIFLSFYLNYFAYLSVGKFSYAFNMTTNIATGVLSAAGWLLWCYIVRHRRPYYKKMVRFYAFMALAMSLELLDFPPILWMFDAHALWHLATAPVATFLYGFIIEDCQMLRKEKQHQMDAKYNKNI